MQAVEVVLREHYDALLMDCQMPVMDGLTAIRAIRAFEGGASRAPTPIIVISASGLAQHVEAARLAGADRHLAKPIRMEALLLALQDSLHGKA